MNIKDLTKTFHDAWEKAVGYGTVDAEEAGIRAVVEALRDELLRKEGPDTHNLSERIGLRVAVKMFNDILGDAGEKAGGK